MSTSSEITRLINAKNVLKAKGVALGIAQNTDNLTQLAAKFDNIVDRGTPQAEVKEGESFTIEQGYYHGGTVQAVGGGGNYNLQIKSVTPSRATQNVTSDEGFYGLSSVSVGPIPEAFQDVTAVTAEAGDVLANKNIVTANGTVTAGTMPNNGAVSATLDATTTSYTVAQGYHTGAGTVGIVLETKTVTPTSGTQNITPTSGKVLSKVTVNPIPAKYKDATGKTVTADKILDGATAVGWDSTTASAKDITGTMPNNGSVALSMDGTTVTSVTVPKGYHDGTGTISLDDTIERALAAI